jgi:hypothetical protein
MHDPDLDAPLAAALSRLSTMHAPETLLPRVLAATQAMASRPWYARTWDTWPVMYQKASVAICLLVLAAMTLTMPLSDRSWIDAAGALTGGRFDAFLETLDNTTRIARGAEAAGSAAGSLWQTLSVPLLLYACVVGALLCLVMGLFSMALDRLTPGKAFSR